MGFITTTRALTAKVSDFGFYVPIGLVGILPLVQAELCNSGHQRLYEVPLSLRQYDNLP